MTLTANELQANLEVIEQLEKATLSTTTLKAQPTILQIASNRFRSCAYLMAFCKIVTTPQPTIQFGWPGVTHPHVVRLFGLE